MENSYVALDLETTGLRPKHDHILEIGAVRVEEGKITGTYETLVDSGVEIPDRVAKLTGIRQEMLQEAVSPGEALEGFLEFAGEAVLLGHNILFDYSFMKRNIINLGGTFERKGLDTLTISRACHPELQAKTLDAMADHYGILLENHHRALDDAMAAHQLYQKLGQEYEKKYPQLFHPVPLKFKIKKEGPITNSQKVHLRDLLNYHRIESNVKIEMLTKNEASRMIDGIILQYGKLKR